MSIADEVSLIRSSVRWVQLHDGDPGAGSENVVSRQEPLFWTFLGHRLRPIHPAPDPEGELKTHLPTQFEGLTPGVEVTHASLWQVRGSRVVHYANVELGEGLVADAAGRFQVTELTITVAEDGDEYVASVDALGFSGWTVQVIECAGTVNAFDTDTGLTTYSYLFSQSGSGTSEYGISNYFGLALDPDGTRPIRFSWVPYPASGNFPPASTWMGGSVGQGKAAMMRQVEHLKGKFIMVGCSQGAMVMDEVYRELRWGSLSHRKPSLLGCLAYGNPRRALGQSFPGCPAAPGHGIQVGKLMEDPEDLWWEFARPFDYLCTAYETNGAQFWATLFALANQDGGDLSYLGAMPLDPGNFLADLPNIFEAAALIINTLAGHQYSDYFDLGDYKLGWRPLLHYNGDDRGCATIGRDYIWSLVERETASLEPNETARVMIKRGDKWQEVG